MPNLSYGSITITDLTDVGQLSVYPTSNMPNTIIYNEDANSFTPDWSNSSSNLELNPVIYYAGDSLAPNASGVTGSLVNGASKACLITRNLNISKKNKTYSYAAAVDIDLKNHYGEYINKIGQINFDKNKFTFDTITDMKN